MVSFIKPSNAVLYIQHLLFFDAYPSMLIVYNIKCMQKCTHAADNSIFRVMFIDNYLIFGLYAIHFKKCRIFFNVYEETYVKSVNKIMHQIYLPFKLLSKCAPLHEKTSLL